MMKNQKNNISRRDNSSPKALSLWDREEELMLYERKSHNKKSWKYSKEPKYDDNIEE
jgi:hypothetical protein